MARISDQLRQQVIQRANGCCEYCQTQQAIVVVMQIDHIVPESAGGDTILDNLCLACAGCNGFKLDFQTSVDPETDEVVALYNPRKQRWSEHFQWSEDGTQLMGLTPTGRATIIRLKINREAVIMARKRWVEAGWHPPKTKD